jgi:hypothetical protein
MAGFGPPKRASGPAFKLLTLKGKLEVGQLAPQLAYFQPLVVQGVAEFVLRTIENC